jgi:hypothetical protein
MPKPSEEGFPIERAVAPPQRFPGTIGFAKNDFYLTLKSPSVVTAR